MTTPTLKEEFKLHHRHTLILHTITTVQTIMMFGIIFIDLLLAMSISFAISLFLTLFLRFSESSQHRGFDMVGRIFLSIPIMGLILMVASGHAVKLTNWGIYFSIMIGKEIYLVNMMGDRVDRRNHEVISMLYEGYHRPVIVFRNKNDYARALLKYQS